MISTSPAFYILSHFFCLLEMLDIQAKMFQLLVWFSVEQVGFLIISVRYFFSRHHKFSTTKSTSNQCPSRHIFLRVPETLVPARIALLCTFHSQNSYNHYVFTLILFLLVVLLFSCLVWLV